MSQPFDLSQSPDLPSEVVKAFEAAQFELSVERAARQHEQAVGAEKSAFITELKALIERLEGQVGQYRHAKFGPKSEKLDPAPLELTLEELKAAIAETREQIAAVAAKIAVSETDPEKKASRKKRKAHALPEHLPRVARVIEPDSIVYPCGCGDMVRIDEDRVDRLDYIPARYQAIVTIRPKYACPKGRAGVVHAKAPAHLLEGSWPTDALLADWMGRIGALIAPVVDRMAVLLKQGSTRLYIDGTTAPVLDPGRGKMKTGYFGRCCTITGAGTIPHHQGWCSTIGPAEWASMPMKS